MVCLRTMKITVFIFQITPHTMEVNRVSHHGVIDQRDPESFTVFDTTGAASENLIPLKDQANFSICPVRCSSMVQPGSLPSGSSKRLLRSA
jgi:hypothetical protein